jgi:hypothetical protein
MDSNQPKEGPATRPQIKEARMKGFGIALTVFGFISIMAAGSARAWPRIGIVGHFSHGPALNRGPVAEQGAKIDVPENSKNVEGSSEHYLREPVKTGNLAEGAQSRSYGDKKREDGKKFDRQDIDVGP